MQAKLQKKEDGLIHMTAAYEGAMKTLVESMDEKEDQKNKIDELESKIETDM